MSDFALQDDDIPASGGLLSLVQVLRNAAVLYRSETILARAMNLPAPADYLARCEGLFYGQYGELAKQVGLSLNRNTIEAILLGELPDGVLNTAYRDLSQRWVFSPSRGWRAR
ncbi:hypothetical protein [Rubrivivax gelatinosus]|uniref:hypothetical protein n=1 Tax=Rubrivivax gelatinosus TaxID=28068 RepID=UPI0005C166E6|nr:hypothetical protein [Rubrivivax gelatinosus]MBG6083199.1 hypothetical protein [Rubrivivax gelatinosus]